MKPHQREKFLSSEKYTENKINDKLLSTSQTLFLWQHSEHCDNNSVDLLNRIMFNNSMALISFAISFEEGYQIYIDLFI